MAQNQDSLDKNIPLLDRLGITPEPEERGSLDDVLNADIYPEGGLPGPSGFGKLNKFDRGFVAGKDFYQNRAENQGIDSELYRAGANLIPNIALGIIENVGYMKELMNYGIAELTDDEYKKDFSNALTKFAQRNRNPAGEIYRQSNKVFDITDSAWWITNGADLVESIGEFLATGVGIGSVTSKGVKSLTKIINNSIKTGKAARGINLAGNIVAQASTASTLGYVEGAISAQQVFQDVYNQQRYQGVDRDIAIANASEAAATTARNNTIIIGALNMSSVFPLFKATQSFNKVDKFKLGRKVGESTDDFIERMAKAQKEPPGRIKSFYEKAAIPIESGQESVEELANLYAEERGRQEGGISDTEASGIGLFFEKAFTEEGALSVILGALGGAGQTFGMNRIPFYRRQVLESGAFPELDETGQIAEGQKVKTKLLSARKLSNAEDESVAVSYAKTLEKDIREVVTHQNELKEAIQEGDKNRILRAKNQLFDVAVKRSIPLDGGEAIKATLQEIADADNTTPLSQEVTQAIKGEFKATPEAGPIEGQSAQTEAMALGLTDSIEDNSYRETALQKIKEIDELASLYDETMAKFDFGDELTYGLGEYVFSLEQRRRSVKFTLSNINEQIANIEAELLTMQEEVLPDELRDEFGTYTNLAKMGAQLNALKSLKEDLSKEKKDLKKKSLDEVKAKHRVQTKEEAEETIDNQIKSVDQEVAELKETIGKFEGELISEMMLSNPYNEALEQGYKARKQVEKDLSALTRRLGYVQSVKGRKEFVDKAKKAYESEKKKFDKAKAAAEKKAKSQKEQEDIQKSREETTQQDDADTTAESDTVEPSPESDDKVPPVEEAEDVASVTEDDGETEIVPEEVISATDEMTETTELAESVVDWIRNNPNAMRRFMYKSKTIDPNKINYGPVQNWVKNPIGDKITASNEFNEYPKIFDSKYNPPMDAEIVISIDTEYDGPRSAASNEPYDSNDIYNNALKIEMNGEIVGYVPTLEWFAEEGPEGYINIPTYTISDDSVRLDQTYIIEKLKAIREAINKKGSVTTKIIGFSQGVPRLNRTSDGRSRNRGRGNVLLPDKSLHFDVVKRKQIARPDGSEIKTDELAEGSLVILADPNYDTVIVPKIDTLGESPNNTIEVIRAVIEAKLSGNKELIASMSEVIENSEDPFDFEDDTGLESFLSRFLFLKSFSPRDLQGLNPERVSVNVSKAGALYITKPNDGIVFTNSEKLLKEGGKYQSILDESGTIKEEVIELLYQVYQRVDASKLNTDTPHDEFYIDEKGKFNVRNHENYNEYVKTFISVYNDGRETITHKDGTVEHLYRMQSVVTYDTSSILSTDALEEIKKLEKSTTAEILLEKARKKRKSKLKSKFKSKKGDSVNDVFNDFAEGLDFGQDEDPDLPETFDMKIIEEDDLKKALGDSLTDRFTEDQINEIISVMGFLYRQEIFNKGNREKTVKNVRNIILGRLQNSAAEQVERGNIELGNVIADIVDKKNFNKLWNRFEEHLISLGFNKVTDDTFEGEANSFEKRKFDSKARFQENQKDTASTDLKLFLSAIPSGFSPWLKMPTFVPLDEIYDKMTLILADKEPDFDTMIRVLKEESTQYKPFMTVAQLLEREGPDSKLPAEFVKVMSKHYTKFVVGIFQESFDRDGNKAGFRNKPINSDRNSAIDMIYSLWNNNLKRSALVKKVDGKLVFDLPEVNALKQEYIESNHGPLAIKRLMEGLGVDMSNKTWAKALDSKGTGFGLHLSSDPRKIGLAKNFRVIDGKPVPNSVLDFIFKALPTEPDAPLELNNPYTQGTITSRFRSLAYLAAISNPLLYTESFTDINNNRIYPFQMHTRMTDTLRKLKNDPEFRAKLKKVPFIKHSGWLDRPDSINLQYIDGLKDQDSTLGDSGENLGKTDAELLSIIMFFGSVFQSEGKTARYQTLTKSDKTTYTMIEGPRIENPNIKMNSDTGEVDRLLNGEGKKAIRAAVMSELGRIWQFNKHVEPYLKKFGIELPGYQEGAKKFVMLPQLSAENAKAYIGTAITQEEYNKIYVEDDVFILREDTDVDSTVTILSKIVEASIIDESKEVAGRWMDAGISGYIDKNYLYNYAKGKNSEAKMNYAAMDFILNQFIANVEQMRLLSGDPAQYWKKDHKTTMDNMNKRLAADIAPRSKGKYLYPTFRMATISDLEVPSAQMEELGEAYGEMNIADAQEYTTVEEHLHVLYAEGKISEEEYNNLVNKIKPGKDYKFSDKELGVLMSPMKPVYTGDHVTSVFKANLLTYVKSSSVPLIPQLLKGTELDKVRKYMEDSQVDRVAFKSAVKVGALSPSVMFNNDRTVVDENPFVESNILTLDRSGFGIQQEVPVKDKQEINVVSQANKLLFQSIRDITGFDFDGKTYSGRELERIKETVRKILVNRGSLELQRKLGISIDDSGDFFFEDLSKVRNVLMDEAKTRGWTRNAIEGIQLSSDRKSFILPLSLSPNAFAIESLILSMISKITLGVKSPGYSYVQVSSAGLKTMGEYQGDIIPTKNWDKKRLKFVSKGKGKTNPAQILIPWRFTDSEGNLLDINDFMTNGVIDDAKLPPEIRKIIGFRIPNQGHNSMLPLEVVGFLPHYMGTAAVVPEEIVVQMGSDFDIDKLYTYMKKYTYDPDTKTINLPEKVSIQEAEIVEPDQLEETIEVVEVEETKETENTNNYNTPKNVPLEDLPTAVLQNMYIDIFQSVLTHPDVFDKVVAPLDKPDLENEKKLIESRTESSVVRGPASYVYQLDYRLNQRTGQKLVGVFALSNTFNAIIERDDINIQLTDVDIGGFGKRIVDKEVPIMVNGETIILSKISGTGASEYEGEKRSKSDNISVGLSISVDNANLNILGSINWNLTTAGVVSAILMAQSDDGKAVNLPWVARFTSQPIIRELVERVENLESTTSELFLPGPEVVSYAIDELEAEYETILDDNVERSVLVSETNMLDKIGKSREDMSNADIAHQLEVLQIFSYFSKVANDIRKIQKIMLSPATSGIDNNLSDALSTLDEFKNMKEEGFTYVQGIESVIVESTSNITVKENGVSEIEINTLTEYGNDMHQIYAFSEQLLKSLLPDSQVYREAFDYIEEATGRKMNRDSRRKIISAYKDYSIAHVADMSSEELISFRKRMMFGENSLGNRVLKALDSWGANNYFLNRLVVDIPENTSDPVFVEFRADKMARLDELKNVSAIRSMLVSDNAEERKLAEDLVLYTLTLGGTQGFRQFTKFVPPKYLSMLDIGKGRLQLKEDPSFIEQALQHNPKLAKTIDKRAKYFKKASKGYVLIATPLEEDSAVTIANAELELPRYLSMYNPATESYDLYKKHELTGKGQIYKKLPSLGVNGLSEYMPKVSIVKSILKAEKTPADAVSTAIEEKKGSEEVIGFNIDPYNKPLVDIGFLLDENGEGKLKNILRAVPANSNVYYLAKLLAEKLPEDHTVRLVKNIGNITRAGQYNRKTREVLLSVDVLNNHPDKVFEVLVHEAVHAAVVEIINYKEFASQKRKLKAIQAKALRELETLTGISDSTRDIMRDQLSDLDEFIARAMTDPNYQIFLDSVIFDNQKTMLERIEQIIAEIIENIAKLILGGTASENSALEAVVRETVMLIENVKSFEAARQMERNTTDASSLFDKARKKRGEDTNDMIIEDVAEREVYFMSIPRGNAKRVSKLPTAARKMAETLKTRITTINRNIHLAGENTAKKEQLLAARERLSKDITALEENASGNTILKVAKAQAAWAKSIAEDPESSDTLFLTALNVVNNWDYDITRGLLNTQQLKYESDSPIKKAFVLADGEMAPIRDYLYQQLLVNIRKKVNKGLPREEWVTPEELKFIDDIGGPTEWLLDLSAVDNKLAQYIYDLLASASRQAGSELEMYDRVLSEKAKKIKDFSVFMQKDENGEYTGNFIDEYSHYYYERKKKIEIARYEAKSPNQSIMKKYHSEMNDIVETFDIRFLYIDNYKDGDFENYEDYFNYLASEYGEDTAKALEEEAKYKYELYLERKRLFEDNLPAEFKLAENLEKLTEEEWIEFEMNKFENENSPIKLIDERKGVYKKDRDRFTTTMAANDYVVTVPRRHTRTKKLKTKFYDKAFAELTPEQVEFYQFFMDSMHKFKGYLPYSNTRRLERNFIPNVSREFVEILKQEGMSAAVEYMDTKMVDLLTTGKTPDLVSKQITKGVEIDPETGKPIHKILDGRALGMLAPSGIGSEQSHNIPVILRQFAGLAINFKWKSEIEDTVNLGLRVMRDAKTITKKNGNPVLSKLGVKMPITEGPVSLINSTEYAINSILYGKKRQEYNPSDIIVFSGWDKLGLRGKKARMKEIENERDQLERELGTYQITQEEYQTEIKKLEEEYKELGGKQLVWGKIGDRFLEITQIKGMGYNLTAGIANVGFGMLSNLTWSASNKDFSGKDLLDAMGIIMRSFAVDKNGKRNYKVANLIKFFDVLFEVTEIEYGSESNKRARTESKEFNFIANRLHPFEIQRSTEYIVQGMSLVAQMLHQKITVVEKATGNKIEISLFDAFDSEAKWNDKYEVNKEWDPAGKNNKVTKFMNKAIQVNKILHGNYDPNSPVLAKKYLIGRGLMQFRSWMPYGFYQRYATEHYDRQLGRKFKGRYRTMYDIGLAKSIKGLVGQIIMNEELAYGKKGEESRLSDIDIANLKMNLRELQILIAFMAMGTMLKMGLKDLDDDDPTRAVGYVLMNQLYRVEQDIWFYLSPGTFEEIVKNPLPVLKTIQDIDRVREATFDFITDEEYEAERVHEKVGKALPLSNQVIKTKYLSKTDISN